ncbi:MAG TPA: lamin tail domain-containing protein [Plantibacter sp.]|uniref:lamin tail domain-containing protein n=1 Tax=Plantibacter sp. TaxID=1871045 RepID=UPI002BACEE1D|nr:lamin tail domain-containing protein [Plantibacter sp.]
MSHLRLRLITVIAALIALSSAGNAFGAGVVISQVYGGGGNSGATLTNDYIELFNSGTTTVDLSTWSVQYASSAGFTWQRTNLTGSLAPGRYYRVAMSRPLRRRSTRPRTESTSTRAWRG